MRSDLEHLPASKRRELNRAVQLIFEEFADAQVGATGRRRLGRIVKIILFGSYARGDWVDEPETSKGFQSDYDLMIVVSDDDLTDRATYWYRAEERLLREQAAGRSIRTPVNFIVHTLQQVNDALAHGRYFFMDIARDGVALYQSDDVPLHRPKPKTPAEALAAATEYFEEWFPSAMQRYDLAQTAIAKGYNKPAAFDLHQTVERLYHCVLLVSTFYTPHVHNVAFLRTLVDKLDRRLFYVWPRDTRAERAMFEKLKDAYVKARYSKHYRVGADELAWLNAHVGELGRVVHDVCLERIGALKAA